MSDLADLYPGFDSHWIDTSAGRMFARSGGKGPPLLLLHGYAQSNVMWHKVAPALAERYTLVIPDLPGYGWSAVPRADDNHAPYDKRSMANIMIEIMEKLGHVRFRLAGHDRGGRVAYRLALDHPGRLERAAVLDIIPTCEMWRRMNDTMAIKTWHWLFLAQKYPMPEMLIEKDPIGYIDYKMASWTKAKDMSAFDPRALAHYHAFFSDPLRIRATCEDYRAGRNIDPVHDEADRKAGKKIAVPFAVFWGASGIPKESDITPLAIWRDWATDVSGRPVESGHFLPEENPEDTTRAMLDFFSR